MQISKLINRTLVLISLNNQRYKANTHHQQLWRPRPLHVLAGGQLRAATRESPQSGTGTE